MKSFQSHYHDDVTQRLTAPLTPGLLTADDVSHLPAPVKRYLHFSGAVGKPKVLNFWAEFSGTMKQKPGAGWIKVKASQHSFFDDPARFFYIRSSLFGVPFDGYHHFSGPHAVMEIRIAGLFRVVNARGPLMDQSETVTFFNDMCLMAPATLIDPAIEWEPRSENETVAHYTHPGSRIRISATLSFDQSGAMINFLSNDRFYSTDGIHGEPWPWSTPVSRYTGLNGHQLPQYGEAIWHTPAGPFTYARFNFSQIEYNIA